MHNFFEEVTFEPIQRTMEHTAALSYTDLIPSGTYDKLPEDILFYFFRQRDRVSKSLDRVASHIERLSPEITEKLQSHLGLQFYMMSRDASGNVCFAEDPNLRPDFRTGFHPFDLWDYYYALWHSPVWWVNLKPHQENLPWPDSRSFWRIVALGKKLRIYHTARQSPEPMTFTMPEIPAIKVEPVDDRFRIKDESEATGRLHLNEFHFIGQVPRGVWEYLYPDYNPLKGYLDAHTGEVLGSDQLRSLCQWIVVIDQTYGIGETVNRILG